MDTVTNIVTATANMGSDP
ncbi:hypothetical protein [Methanosarcina sp. UBA5]|nr:hypothetical protein [Methanosarcina sp. UBA5]